MSALVVIAVLFDFASTAAALVNRIHWSSRSQASNQIVPILNVVGTLVGLISPALFVYEFGFLYGLLYWFGLSALMIFVLSAILNGFDGLLSLTGLAAGVAGSIWLAVELL